METVTNQLPLAAYSRVSTHGQAESGLGIRAQKRQITEAADAHGFTVGTWHADEGRSGASMRNRPGLQEALTEVREGRAGGIVCAKLDRLGRSTADMFTLVEEAQKKGWRLVAIDAGLDTTTTAGEIVAMALAMAARFEWRRISERQHEKFRELRKEGRPRGRPAVPAKVADRIIGMRDQGMTYRAIAEKLTVESVPTARSATVWHFTTVRSAEKARKQELSAQTG